jgi:hypothetical protein
MSLTKVSSAVLNIDDLYGFRNRIINGDMRIDQRNAGASVTNTGATTFYLDRWNVLGTTSAGQFSIQQVTDAPAGFVNSAKITVTTVDSSLAADDRYVWMQRIEGYNVSDFGFGTANATTVTVSFWVKSSLTGTFGGALDNGGTRSYPFSYTISAANTWEQKTVTIAGDTSGTWPTDNSRAMQLIFSLGAGSDYEGTVNTWAAATYFTVSGATNVLGTLNATWQVTGVQLEVGTVATPFERRPFGMELALCQRYFTFLGGRPAGFPLNQLYGATGNFLATPISFPVRMRASPTATREGTWVANNCSQPTFLYNSPDGTSVGFTVTSTGLAEIWPSPSSSDIRATFSAEL